MTDANQPPIGERFDHVYIERGDPVRDSPRMRRRLYSLFREIKLRSDVAYGSRLEAELGIEIQSGYAGYVYEPFFTNAALTDVLSGITIIWREAADTVRKTRWLRGVDRIFLEENTTYRVDERGGVHYAPDEEYERNRASAVVALSGPRYAAACQAFEATQSALNAGNRKSAIRSTFEAAEIVFRLICERAPRLAAGEVERHLKPVVTNVFAADDTARKSALQFTDSLKAWVDAAHWYRHGQADEQPRDPPEPITIALISSGASYLRWLAELDKASITGAAPEGA